MDLSFDRRVARGHGAEPALDYLRLVSSITATQAASRTAATEARLTSAWTPLESPIDALVRLFDPGLGWASGVAALGGSFNPRLAGSATIRAPDAT